MKPTFLSLAILSFLLACRPAPKQSAPPSQASIFGAKPAPAMCGPITSDRAWYDESTRAPLFEGMGPLEFPVTTTKELAQQYVNQGLVLAYGFNHAEAARSFHYATSLDPTCAMAYWGYAYVLGPNYNAGMEPDNFDRAYEAIQQAVRLSDDYADERERDLIAAMATRYVADPPEDRTELDAAYSASMKDLHEKYPEDPDIGTMYAESIMDLHPWDLFDQETGVPRPWTGEIMQVLEETLDQHPDHCGAHHFYIHAVEASPHPERGIPSARAFDNDLVPNAGHLVHMPSHIYIRTGDYHAGTEANIRAIEVDSTYVANCHAQGAYPLAYFPHNQHFLAATATLEGNQQWALSAADAVSENANRQLMREPGWGTLQHYYAIPYYVYPKFAQWEEILKMDNETPNLPYPTAMYQYARGLAYLHQDSMAKAKQAWEQVHLIAQNQQLRDVTIWDINTVYDLVQIADKVLFGQILAQEGDYKASIAVLQEAVEIEDQLNYNEPPDWFFSVRHVLGDVQLQAGKYDDAAETFRQDLERLPKNGWALNGLVIAYGHLDAPELQKGAQREFQEAWKHADVELEGAKVQ
ncbi:tetratricopeptide repeat protein [Pontibacter sp. G13]|uniref:tetratricopeptide repeat protein n=1 Tax=Pontibacter sp. G13 TaxID=3074898 RepID=UPI002888FAD5|nr:tetratricopeptide repeat protein [Pontibacter sp. G13]WNJ20090.1 tetratricopeptide repeat protein [Pontibacter sp. G13]